MPVIWIVYLIGQITSNSRVTTPKPGAVNRRACRDVKFFPCACTGSPYNSGHAHRDRNPYIPEAGREDLVKSRTAGVYRLDCDQSNGWRGDSGADGARKVRWSRAGSGKSGGARVIYFNLTEEEVVLLVAMYSKTERTNMSPTEIRKVV